MKIQTQLSPAGHARTRARDAAPQSGAPFADLLAGLDEAPESPQDELAELDRPEGDEDTEGDSDSSSYLLASSAQTRETQAPLRITSFWNPRSSDPRSVSVGMTGSTDSSPHTLTTRESGLEARGLRSGAVPPGGVGIDQTPGLLGTGSDSREVPLHQEGLSQGRDVTDVVAARVGDAGETPSASPKHATGVRHGSTQETRSTSAPVDPPSNDAQRPPNALDDSAADELARPVAANAPRFAEAAAQEPSTDALDGDSDLLPHDLDEAPTATRAAIGSAGPGATDTPSRTTAHDVDPPTMQAHDDADLPDLPPHRVGDGPIRVAIDDDLSLEVRADDTGVDVTLEGSDEAVRPLSDVGPELEEDLARHGWDLRQFGSRRDRDAPTTQHHAGSPVVDEDTPDVEPANRTVRHGKLVDTLA